MDGEIRSKTMTTVQRQAMQIIQSAITAQMADIESRIDRVAFPNATPSKFIHVEKLIRVHRIRQATVDCLVKAGRLVERNTNGFGKEVAMA